MKAPFPYFGGKRRVAHVVWDRFGDVSNYVEPFFGSGAVLLERPHEPRCETVNDKDAYVANFWRSVQWHPEEVARWSDWPVNEADLHARHRWLVGQKDFRERMGNDPDFCDPKIAGWWVWGISQWIGSGWCARPEWTGGSLAGRASRGINSDGYLQRPNLTKRGHSSNWEKRPIMKRGGVGVHRKVPVLKSSGGVHGQLPQLSGDGSGSGRGVHSRSVNSRKGQWQTRPFLNGSNGIHAISENLVNYMLALQNRLRRVRVCCGDWKRILGPSPTTCIGLTAIFLDPPYSEESGRDASIYSTDCLDVAHDVAVWAREHGDDPLMRIALCGYEGEHTMPPDWCCVEWKANGGYGNQAHGKGFENAKRERIWFSPHCLRASEPEFDLAL